MGRFLSGVLEEITGGIGLRVLENFNPLDLGGCCLILIGILIGLIARRCLVACRPVQDKSISTCKDFDIKAGLSLSSRTRKTPESIQDE